MHYPDFARYLISYLELFTDITWGVRGTVSSSSDCALTVTDGPLGPRRYTLKSIAVASGMGMKNTYLSLFLCFFGLLGPHVKSAKSPINDLIIAVLRGCRDGAPDAGHHQGYRQRGGRGQEEVQHDSFQGNLSGLM